MEASLPAQEWVYLMFNRKQRRIDELESELSRITGLMADKFDLVLEKVDAFDPKAYQQGLGLMAALKANENAAELFERMRGHTNR